MEICQKCEGAGEWEKPRYNGFCLYSDASLDYARALEMMQETEVISCDHCSGSGHVSTV